MELQGYEITQILAQSDTTMVHRAKRKSDGASVVIKTSTREYPMARELGQLEFEYRILRKLEAPAIVRALGLERSRERLLLILEDFEGRSLIGAGREISLDHFFDIAVGVARALGHVHSRDVIHKDVTPGNILFNATTRETRLIDFGIASELSQERQGGDATQRIEGALAYISPEQTGRMNRDLDYRSDYYSLGVTLFELLTGRLPFSAPDVMGWVHCHISKAAPSVRTLNPAVPESLARVVGKLLSKNPDDRYQGAHGLLRDLLSCKRQWQGELSIADFTPGEQDTPERFQISQQLFGRDREIALLIEAFEDASRGNSRLLLVGGHPGVGKSALIHEIQRDIVRNRGYFVTGKFDQLERNVPYAAIIHALRGLIRQLLAEPEESLQRWRERLSSALDPNGRVLIELLPELEQILGPKLPVPELHPREARARFQQVFSAFIKTVARSEHPLVLFVDDLQWTDTSTPELVLHLLGDSELRHFLMIGSFRDNEVLDGHPLLALMKQLGEERPDSVTRMSLGPLDEPTVAKIVAGTLRCDMAAGQPLAELIFQKTAGNPFFVKELLGMLARDGAFRFEPEEGRWDWDPEKIRAAKVSGNVVDLMIDKLRRLPAEAIEALTLAACLGNEFELDTIARLSDKRPRAIAAALWEAVQERVIVPIGTSYRLVHETSDADEPRPGGLDVQYQFQHDRVQQAAYALIEERERPSLHLRIGRMLLRSESSWRDKKLFELVNHLNLGRALITREDELVELSRLNEAAGRKARQAAAYAVAAAYFERAAELLPAAERLARPRLDFSRRHDRAECIFFSGDPERASSLSDELVEAAPDRACRVSALELKARILDHQGRLKEAIGTLRQGLTLLGLDLPEDPAELDRQIGEGIGKMQAHLARVPIEDFVDLPQMVDEEKITMMDLLFQLVIPSIQANPPLFVLVELVMFDLALTHGTTAVSSKNFVDCGIIQGPVLGDYERGYRLGKVAFEFIKREGSRYLSSAVSFVFASFVSHWRVHYRESLDVFVDCERWAVEFGDLQHMLYALSLSAQRWFFAGRPLDQCHLKCEQAASQLKQMRATNQLVGLLFVQRAIAELRGSEADTAFLREWRQPIDQMVEQSGNAQFIFLHNHAGLLTSFILGDYEGAERWNRGAIQYLMTGGNIHFSLADQYLLSSLLITHQWDAYPEGERASLRQALTDAERKLGKLAENCPDNFAHKHHLLRAEIARIEGASLDAVVNEYGLAIARAGDDFVHLRALANELFANYWASKNQARIARLFLEEAFCLYDRWGAQAKLRQLSRAHPGVFANSAASLAAGFISADNTRKTGFLQAGSLDLESIIKATRAISSEVKVDRLLAKLMATIIENAGAERGCLILPDATGELYVEAVAPVDQTVDTGRRVPLQRCAQILPDVVRYVARSRVTVAINDATQEDLYREHDYVRREGIKSILCMPVLHQGKILAIFYAENNETTHAFTPHQLRLLEVLAGQAAISMTNARLYDSLEEKVAERTRELAEKNEEVSVILDSIQQGIFTIDDRLAILPGYSAQFEQILGKRDLVGQDCIEALFAGSNVSSGELELMRATLLVGFHEPVELAKLNAPHLKKEFQRNERSGAVGHFEVDWNFIKGQDGNVAKMLVAVRNVTVVKQLHASAANKARQVDIVGQLLDAGLEAFHGVWSSGNAFLRENATVLERHGELSAEHLDLLFRNMHTVKGNARMLGLSFLAEAAHAAEQAYELLRVGAGVDRETLLTDVENVAATLSEYEEVRRRKLGDLGRAAERRPEDALAEIAALVRTALQSHPDSAGALRNIDRAISRANSIPLRDVVRDAARALPSLARDLGKPPPEVSCSDGGLRVVPALARVLADVLVHAFRNAIDHGIETAAERKAKQKPEAGCVAVRIAKLDGRVAIFVGDDGRGLSLGRLRARMSQPDASDDQIAERIFASGVSTADEVTTISGRGVGLDAVRSFLRAHGGDAHVAFTGEPGDDHRPFELVLEIPEEASFVDVVRSPSTFPTARKPAVVGS